jgi:hypothetical protein
VAAHSTAATCSSGECVAVCASGFEDCNASYADGCESDLGVPATCGGCNAQCATGLACELGDCVQLPELVWSMPLAVGAFNRATIVSIADGGDLFVGGAFQVDPVDHPGHRPASGDREATRALACRPASSGAHASAS